LALVTHAGVPLSKALYALRDFRGLPHRVEWVRQVRGVDFIEDSKGTNVGAAVAALQGLKRRVVLIAGGDGKGQDFSPLLEPVRCYAQAVILIGRDAARLQAALAESGVRLETAPNLEQAVQRAADLAQAGEAVLLSPACASFDMFRHYEHRAEVFIQAVQNLALEQGEVAG
jgi:UDP-N-acetylmuramoylalanine--D-glutamate ligase